ncbi:MAG TPA: RNA polymerase subunit sigma-70, partial [Pirellulaceae bacterium]
MKSTYKSAALRQLRDQLTRFSPRERKLSQVSLAEQLIEELEPSRTYSYEYLHFRVTGFRPNAVANELIEGGDARNDLRLLVEDVFDSANVRAEDVPEPVRTVEQLSSQLNVSSKTIARW